jgi:hypothetical protein
VEKMSAIDLLFEQELLRRRAMDKNLSTERIYKGQSESKERIYDAKFDADKRGYEAEEYKAGAEAQTKFYETYINALTMISEFDGKNPKKNIFKRGDVHYVRPQLSGGSEQGLYGEEVEISMQEYIRLEKENQNTIQLRSLVMQGYLPQVKASSEYDKTDVARAKNAQQTDKSNGQDPPRKIEVDDKTDKIKVDGKTVSDVVKSETGFSEDEFYKMEGLDKDKMFKFGYDKRHPISGLVSMNPNYDPSAIPGETGELQLIKPKHPKQYYEGLSRSYDKIGDPTTDMLTRTKGGITAGSMPTMHQSVDTFSQLTDKQNADLVRQHKQAMADGLVEEGETVEVNAQGKLVFRQK